MLKEEYKNIVAFHPGYYLNDIIEELEMTQEEFAKRLGTSGKTVSKLLNGQIPLSRDLAMKASAMFGISVGTFLNLQKSYDEKIIEIEMAKRIDAQKEIVKVIDYKYFSSKGFLPEVSKASEKIENLCAFLNVSDLTVLKQPDLLASFRTGVQTMTDKNIINANVWLQTALKFGFEKEVEPFNEKKLKAAIPEIRSMTLKSPEEFLPRLEQIFGECGVAFVVLPALKNCGVNGVVKWYDEKVVLAINDRKAYADTFWFSLFHEIKHVLQKKKTKVIISDPDFCVLDDMLEKEADSYAQNTLISPNAYTSFLKGVKFPISSMQIKAFADEIGVHPGIVVGRLQHDNLVSFSYFTDLKEKYKIVV